MFAFWVIVGLVLAALGEGYSIVHIDAVVPVLFGHYWKREDRWKRFALELPMFFVGSTLPWVALASIHFDFYDWATAVIMFVVSFYLGVSAGSLLLVEARGVVKAIIDTMIPAGGEIPYSAADIGAAQNGTAFLDQIGGPYPETLYVIASAINNPLVSWMLLATFTRFSEMSSRDQEEFVNLWINHENLLFRSLAQPFKALGCLGFYSDARVWREIGYPGPSVPQYSDSSLQDIAGPKEPGDVEFKLTELRPRVNSQEQNPEIYGLSHFLRRKRRYKVVDADMKVSADVCVIGSGAGGAVISWELCKNPKIRSIVILEAGGYYEGEDFNQRELDMLPILWKGGALTFNQDFSIFIGQGETLGGTTVINHAICIDTPTIVLKEWQQMGAGTWNTDIATFARSIEEVKREIHVSPVDPSQFNRNNQILRDGASALGIDETGRGPNPRNDLHCRQCGFSHLGCHFDTKQSTLVTYLPWALDTGKCKIFCNAWAERITIRGRRTTGVDAVLVTKSGEERGHLRVDAKMVVVAAGAINSTALLKRSKVPDPHNQLGKGLTIHPSPLVIGEFEEEVRSYSGIPMAYHVSKYSVLNGVPGATQDDSVTGDAPNDQRGGFMLESVFPNLGQFAAFLPGIGLSHKALMKKLNYYAAAGILIRDTPKGLVTTNASGDPVIQYRLSNIDRVNLANGMKKLAEIYFKAGARRVILTYRTPTIIERDDYLKDPEAIQRIVSPRNCGEDNLFLGAVHPQGGNRLGTQPEYSVVNEHCVHHYVNNLVVCDASIFPTAVGVNPMLTIMGIAKRTAKFLDQNWETQA